jgi:hypothetical protein
MGVSRSGIGAFVTQYPAIARVGERAGARRGQTALVVGRDRGGEFG